MSKNNHRCIINTKLRSKFPFLQKGWRAKPDGVVSARSSSPVRIPLLAEGVAGEARRGSVGRRSQMLIRRDLTVCCRHYPGRFTATPSTKKGNIRELPADTTPAVSRPPLLENGEFRSKCGFNWWKLHYTSIPFIWWSHKSLK